jgi:hypothetical protein
MARATAPPTPEPSAPPATVAHAEELFARGHFAGALAEARRVLEREPGNREAAELAQDAEVELVVDRRLQEARDALAAGDADAALEAVKLGLAAKPTDARLVAFFQELTRR